MDRARAAAEVIRLARELVEDFESDASNEVDCGGVDYSADELLAEPLSPRLRDLRLALVSLDMAAERAKENAA